jgi:hypothetical protein
VDIVRSFGILDDTAVRQQLGWRGDFLDLNNSIRDFGKDVSHFPDRILPLELAGG